MTEADFNQIRLIVTEVIAASEARTTCAITEAIAASETRMIAANAASEKRLLEALARAVVDLDRRIIDLEKRMIERTARVHTIEISQNDVNIRLAALEERILNLETRRPIVPPAA
jgi:hypothetical protein